MDCAQWVSLPEEVRRRALAYQGRGEGEVPAHVTCELDPHPYGEHVALLRYLMPAGDVPDELWVAWGGGVGMELRCLPACEQTGPTAKISCWLPVRHRGGHVWERYE
ncbi:hypothetical protein AB0L54_33045 [Streptomyces sp. NPDC052196]|uniref:hypothetical protein n=1 Tax=Streptomyces sp. NPDC052196 TaxID=3156691 RepID=UPI00342DF8FF